MSLNFVPVLHSAAGVPYAQPGILEGFASPPTSFNASLVFILYLSVESIFNTGPWFVQVFLNQSLRLAA